MKQPKPSPCVPRQVSISPKPACKGRFGWLVSLSAYNECGSAFSSSAEMRSAALAAFIATSSGVWLAFPATACALGFCN
eukprot:1888998-Amphidinium_carterae.1